MLDGGRSYMQKKESGQQTTMNYEEGHCITRLRLPSKGEEAQKDTEKVLRGNRYAILAAESE